MKLRIVTFHRAYNYGAVLQCYALAETINSLGADCEVLDYWPDVFREVYYMKIKYTGVRSTVRAILNKANIYPMLNKRNNNFGKFIKEKIPITKLKYGSLSEIKCMSSDIDAYLTGSDQVWHNKWAEFDPVYFLDFPDANTKKKYSYAASFGMNEVPSELRSEYKRRLEKFEKISVRENSGVKIVEDLINKKSECNCDPTLLLTKEYWRRLVKEYNDEPYILVYYTSRSKLLQDSAEKLSKKTGYKVICLPCTMDTNVLSGKYDSSRGFEVAASAGPNEFLSLIANAKYVLTNTFHGTVFSIIFERKFMTQMILSNQSKNMRVSELLEKLGIEGRELENGIECIEENVDWTCVCDKIYTLREDSLKYLKSIIN